MEEYVALARAGEGIDRKIREEYEWHFFYFAGVTIGLVVFTALAWVMEWLWGAGLKTLTIGAIAMAIGTGVWAMRKRRAMRTWKLGYQGEVAVGEVLDGLRERGYRVFHDVGSEGKGNIDHVVIGPSGVYVIETKTRSLPREGRAVIETDGRRVRVGEHAPWDEHPIRQACAARGRVRQWLQDEGMGERADWNVPVRAVVMYPGWNDIRGSRGKEVWVLKPGALETWIAEEERQVEPLAADRLKMLLGRFEKYAKGLVEKERARV